MEQNKKAGLIDAPTYHTNMERITALKKLKFLFGIKSRDLDLYEWMKLKVSAEVGGEAEREAFLLFEKIHIDAKGERGYKLWTSNVEKDPEMRKIIPGY